MYYSNVSEALLEGKVGSDCLFFTFYSGKWSKVAVEGKVMVCYVRSNSVALGNSGCGRDIEKQE